MRVKRPLLFIFIIPTLLAIALTPAWAGVTGKIVGKLASKAVKKENMLEHEKIKQSQILKDKVL